MMELRSELMPPAFDRELIARLAKLAAHIDGASHGLWEDELAEFNRLAGTAIPFEEFQGVYGGYGHEAYVRRILLKRYLATAPNVSATVTEMTEIVLRVMACETDQDFYLELFLANCKHPSGTDLIFWPDLVPELPRGCEPTNREIAELALRDRV